jgi:hypothetical protein
MSQPLSFNQYIVHAKAAVQYVKSYMKVGAANKASDIIGSRLGSPIAVSDMRGEADSLMYDGDSWLAFRGPHNKVDVRAWLAKEHGAGNCGEQSALAFVYLRERGVFPLDWCQFLKPHRDHAFVILNAKAEIRSNNFSEWSKGAVLCDPWGGRVEEAGCLAWRWGCDHVTSTVHIGLGGEGMDKHGMGGMDMRYRP